MKLQLTLLTILLNGAQSTAQASTGSIELFAPDWAFWLGGKASWDGTPIKYHGSYPITYVAIGKAAMPLVCSILDVDNDCPIPQNICSG